MTQNHIYIVLFSLYMMLLVSCIDENNQSPCTLPECNSAFGVLYEEDTVTEHYWYPTFNPDNADEFACVTRFFSNGQEYYEVVKYNMVTQQVDVLMQGTGFFPVNHLKWGRNSLLVFESTINSQIYKLNPSTQAVTQLTFTNQNNDPGWDYSGTKIMYRKQLSGTDSRAVLMDSTGSNIDTLDYPVPFSITQTVGLPNGHYLCMSQYDYIYEYDQNLGYIQIIDINTSDLEFGGDMDWIPGTNKVICTVGARIYLVDFVAHSTTIIMDKCESKLPYSVAVSPNGDKMLVSIIKYEAITSCNQKTRSELHWMNIDGSNDVIIELP